MATPCSNDPNEVIAKVVSAEANADKFDKFVNGTDTETVQLGSGDQTPTIRNAVRQIMADSTWAKDFIADAPEGDVSLNNARALGGVVSRTLADRFADTVNVLEFGAKGDGATDDYAALQAAFDYEADTAKSRTIDLRGRIYAISRPLTISRTLTTLKNGTIICLASNYWALDSNDTTVTTYGYTKAPAITCLTDDGWGQCTFKDLIIDCGFVSSGINVDDSRWDCVFDNVRISRMVDYGYGILCEGRQSTFINVRVFEYAYQSNVSDYNQFLADGIVTAIGDCKYSDCVVWNCKNGITIYEGTALVSNTHVWGCSVKGDANILVYAAGNCQFSNIYLDNGSCKLYNTIASFDGVYVLRNFARLPEDFIPFIFVTTRADSNIYKLQMHRVVFDWNASHTQLVDFQTAGSGSWVDGTTSIENLSDIPSFYGQNGGEIICTSSANTNSPLLLKSLYTDSCALKMTTKNNVKNAGAVLGSDGSFGLSANYSLVPSFYLYEYQNNNCKAELAGAYAAGFTGMKFSTSLREAYTSIKSYFSDGTASGSASISLAINDTAIVSAQTWGFAPGADNTYLLGGQALRWSAIWAATGSIYTSDARCKDNVAAPSDALMRAWGKVGFKVFQFKDAIEKKGAEARLHVGVIAQEIIEAFASEGLEATRYGLLCWDRWEDEYVTETVLDAEAVLDADGNVVVPEQTHTVRRLVTPAGERYGVRYDEALALECAYQRWLGEQRDTRIAELEARLNELSVNGSAPSGASPDNL